MKSLLQPTTWHTQSAWALENEHLRTVVVPEMGAKIVSLFDKRSQTEWLVGPGERAFQPAAYGAAFEKQDMSGWDEMFPTISTCAYPGPGAYQGVALPDHGEVWCLPWQLQASKAGVLALSVQGRALPYSLKRSLRYSQPDTLLMQYELINLGEAPMPYMWAAHPQFAVGEAAQIVLPPHIRRVCNSLPEAWGWGAPETGFDWPAGHSPQGEPLRLDQIGPPSLRRARKLFALPEDRMDWCQILPQPGPHWLRLEWDAAQVPYFGLWVDEGALGPLSVAAPEPITGFYDSLEIAWHKQEVTILAPGEVRTWALSVSFGVL